MQGGTEYQSEPLTHWLPQIDFSRSGWQEVLHWVPSSRIMDIAYLHVHNYIFKNDARMMLYDQITIPKIQIITTYLTFVLILILMISFLGMHKLTHWLDVWHLGQSKCNTRNYRLFLIQCPVGVGVGTGSIIDSYINSLQLSGLH